MIVTDIEIKDMMYSYLKDSALVADVSGKLYKDLRPLNSQLEDVVISVLARDGAQLQNFIINVNVYVPKIKRGHDMIEDSKRLRQLCFKCAELFSEHVLDKFIFDFDYQAVMEAQGTDFHIINNRVKVIAYTGN